MKYNINGPEGYPVHPEGYKTLDEMVRAAARFILRFVHQGYYKDTRMIHRDLDWVAENLSAETYDDAVTAPEAYVHYIQDNLERIGRDGWVPVCYAEFLESEECEERMIDEDAPPLPAASADWHPIGYVGVDSGQLMVCDPCYVDGEWLGDDDRTETSAPGYRHADGRVFYCALHGAAPTPDAIVFGHFSDILQPFGESVNDLISAGVLTEYREEAGKGEFSYTGCCQATQSSDKGGPMNFRAGHDGAGVAFSTGFGDGFYPVYARYYEDAEWGKRVAEVRIVMIGEEDA